MKIYRFFDERRRHPLAVLGLLAILGLSPLPLFGQAAPATGGNLISQESTLKTPDSVTAVAISPDESLIAAVAGKEGGKTRVTILDRSSRAVLGSVVADVGDGVSIRFSPLDNLLLIAGDEALELWEVPVGPLNPKNPLSDQYRRWRNKQNGNPGDITFGHDPHRVIWSQKEQIYQREVRKDSPAPKDPILENKEGGSANRFALLGDGKTLAFHGGDSKDITLVDPARKAQTTRLEGHRFPVVAATTGRGGALVSLDQEGNIIRWKANGKPEYIRSLRQDGKEFTPSAIKPLNPPLYLIQGKGGSGEESLIYNANQGKVVERLQLASPQSLAISPTGRYLASGDGKAVQLYGFAAAISPQTYVRELKGQNAFKIARNYVSLLDETGLSPNLKPTLLNQLDRVPSNLRPDDLLISLSSAEQEGNLEAMLYWARKVLAVDPSNPVAIAALGKVRERQETALLEQARDALEQGQNRRVITLLTKGIPSQSPRYTEALELIKQAEAARSVQTLLEQAREKMELGNMTAAEAMTREALRKNPGNPVAEDLLEEIHDRSSMLSKDNLGLISALMLGLGMLVALLYRFREIWWPAMRTLSINETEESFGPTGEGFNPNTVRNGPPPRPEPAETPRQRGMKSTFIPPRPDPKERENRKAVEDLLAKTEEMIRLCRQQDTVKRHTAFLLEVEAELNTIHRRVAERAFNLKDGQTRLNHLIRQLKELDFSEPKKKSPEKDELNYYELLKLTSTARPEEIKAAYHRMLKEYHPDLHSHSDFGWVKAEAEKMSKQISEAYEVLSDTARRQSYDRMLREKGKSGK